MMMNEKINDLKEATLNYAKENGDVGLNYDCVYDAFKAGANWQKEKMMNDAVECIVGTNREMTHKLLCFSPRGQQIALDDALNEINTGDKVKVIIVK